MFSAAYTEWALSPARFCETVPTEGVERIEALWSTRSEGMDYGEWYTPGREPFLWVTYYGEGGKRDFFVTADESGTRLAEAAAITLRVFVDTYGERFERELRGAGLGSLLE